MGTEKLGLFRLSEANGFFGLFTNNLANVLVLTGLLTFTVQMPADLVFGRILPATGLAVFLASAAYTFLAYRLAKSEGRSSVTALPAGISVPHMFLIVFMVILPVKLATGNAELAWLAGIAWCFIEGIVALCGVAVGPWIRRHIPRAALLGSLAGVSMTAIMANNAIQSWEVPPVAFVSLAVVLLGFVAKAKMPFNLPVGLVAIVLGSLIGWSMGLMSPAEVAASVVDVGARLPVPEPFGFLHGVEAAAPFLVSAIPLGIYNFMETIDNVESAAVAGDSFNTRQVLVCDGLATVIGSLFGGVIPIAVYIGHPGWKQVGAGIGYSGLNGLCVLGLGLFGLASVLISVIPLVALLPVLIYIGIAIGTQAFDTVPKAHYPAVILAILPWLADWGQTLVGNAVTATGAPQPSLEAFNAAGIHWLGFEIVGGGAILVGIIWATLLIYLMERNVKGVCILCGVAAILAFFGIIHASGVGIGAALGAAVGYGGVALVSVLVLGRGETPPGDGLSGKHVPESAGNGLAEGSQSGTV